MKTPKKITLFFILAIGIITTTFESCKKYPEGPTVVGQSRTSRVANTWKVDSYKKNGIDSTASMGNYSETYTKDMTYSYESGNYSGSGTWDFQNDDKEIRITISGVLSEVRVLTILRLTSNDFWYSYMDGNDKREFHMIQK